METILAPEEKQRLRHAALRVLAWRHPAALSPAQVRHRAAMDLDFAFSEPDTAAALEILVSVKYADKIADALGSGDYYRATADGVIQADREAK